jgi:Kdo2-lipid IVA lauroyltransferase/acyltransferase
MPLNPLATAVKDSIRRLQSTPAGRFFYYCVPWRRRVVLENLNLVFAQVLTPTEIVHLAKCFYSHLATSLWEMLSMRLMPLERIRQRGEVRGVEHIRVAAAAGRGVLVLSGHFGNWEFAPIACIGSFPEFKGRFHLVRKSIRMQWVERILFRRYFQAGLQVIPKRDSLVKAQQALAAGDAVVMVMDQAASIASRIGIAVPFFGRPAGTYKSLALLASDGVPVVPAVSFRTAQGKHVLEFHPALPWQSHPQPQAEILQNTQVYNEILEQFVLAHPEQWFWMHRRWKSTV